jgi:hypothetical protein
MTRGVTNNFSEAQWQAAFKYIKEHKGEAHVWKNALAQLPGCSRTTLKTRFKSQDATQTVKGPAPRLGNAFEDKVVEWVTMQMDVANCINKDDVKRVARAFAKSLGLDEKAVCGKHWWKAFKADTRVL